MLQIVDAYQELGIQGITLADTTGMANPRQVDRLVRRVLQRVSPADLTLHFHNTRGLGLCNVLAAYEAGARRFDAALGGLGGCPFAPGASGNICTEDLVNLCDEIGIHTGIDLPLLLRLVPRIARAAGPRSARSTGQGRTQLRPASKPFLTTPNPCRSRACSRWRSVSRHRLSNVRPRIAGKPAPTVKEHSQPDNKNNRTPTGSPPGESS